MREPYENFKNCEHCTKVCKYSYFVGYVAGFPKNYLHMVRITKKYGCGDFKCESDDGSGC